VCVFENKVLRKVSGPKRVVVTVWIKYIKRSFGIFTVLKLLLA